MPYILIIFLAFFTFGCGNEITGKEFFLSAQKNYAIKNFDLALDYLKEAERNNYDSALINFLMGKIYFMENNFEEAEKCFQVCLNKRKDFTDAGIYLIRSLILQKKFTAADDILKDYLVYNSNDSRIYYLAALNAAGKKNIQDQLGYLHSARVYAQDSWKVFFENAKVRLALDDKGKAMENLMCAKALLPPQSQYRVTIEEIEKQINQSETTNSDAVKEEK